MFCFFFRFQSNHFTFIHELFIQVKLSLLIGFDVARSTISLEMEIVGRQRANSIIKSVDKRVDDSFGKQLIVDIAEGSDRNLMRLIRMINGKGGTRGHDVCCIGFYNLSTNRNGSFLFYFTITTDN